MWKLMIRYFMIVLPLSCPPELTEMKEIGKASNIAPRSGSPLFMVELTRSIRVRSWTRSTGCWLEGSLGFGLRRLLNLSLIA